MSELLAASNNNVGPSTGYYSQHHEKEVDDSAPVYAGQQFSMSDVDFDALGALLGLISNEQGPSVTVSSNNPLGIGAISPEFLAQDSSGLVFKIASANLPV